MELPSTRELELETLLRLRDTQLTELTDELTHLRQFLASQPGPSTSSPVTLPPAFVSVLLPHLHTTPAALRTTVAGSNTVNVALTQRARLLQEENDELYDLLKQSETGKLKEEVRGLRRVVAKLQSALQESHQTISSLSSELDKSYETFMSSVRTTNNNVSRRSKSYSQSPRTSYHPPLPTTDSGNGAVTKPTPTGPRAHKKARLSEANSQGSPPQRAHASLAPAAAAGTHKRYGGSHNNNSSRGTDTREYPPRRSVASDGRVGKINHYQKMEVEEDQPPHRQQQELQRARPSSPIQERERDRDRDRRGRDRESEGERDEHRSHRRNGGGGGRGRRHDQGQVSVNNETMHSGDRTLRERMGL